MMTGGLHADGVAGTRTRYQSHSLIIAVIAELVEMRSLVSLPVSVVRRAVMEAPAVSSVKTKAGICASHHERAAREISEVASSQ
jgi:hypothetical protein